MKREKSLEIMDELIPFHNVRGADPCLVVGELHSNCGPIADRHRGAIVDQEPIMCIFDANIQPMPVHPALKAVPAVKASV